MWGSLGILGKYGAVGQEGGARYGLIQHEGQEQEGVVRGCDIQGFLVKGCSLRYF